MEHPLEKDKWLLFHKLLKVVDIFIFLIFLIAHRLCWNTTRDLTAHFFFSFFPRRLCVLGLSQTRERQATLRETTFKKAERKNNIGQGGPPRRARDISNSVKSFVRPRSLGTLRIYSVFQKKNISFHAALASAAVIKRRQFVVASSPRGNHDNRKKPKVNPRSGVRQERAFE